MSSSVSINLNQVQKTKRFETKTNTKFTNGKFRISLSNVNETISNLFIKVVHCITANVQGLAKNWNLKLVSPNQS